jgi:chemotaxis protein MotB
MAGGHGRRRGHGGEHESEERWLLTYADMITLLMALFMVLFSISSVNISKYETLQKSLKAAFSGNILPGGKSVAQQGATDNSANVPSKVELQAIEPVATEGASATENSTAHGSTSSPATSSAPTSSSAVASSAKEAAARNQAAEFQHIKAELEAYAASHGFAKSVKATIEARGLVIRVLTDDLLFASGQATLEPRANGLLTEIAQLLNVDETHPISVEGNTDNVPIHSSIYPSNWELSTARASTVVRFLIAHGVGASRLTALGNAEQHPVDSNATAAGRARNRRVEIVMRRISSGEGEGESGPEGEQ